jgi:Glycosyl transferase family 2
VHDEQTDDTFAIAQRMAAEFPQVAAVHLDRKGCGRALRQVWSSSEADIVTCMDADLSTGLDAFLPLIAPLLSGHSDLAIGSRLAHSAQMVRGPKREIISRSYNLLLRAVLAARFSDAQCGFKAGRADVIRALLPAVEDDAWFFDTELLVLARPSRDSHGRLQGHRPGADACSARAVRQAGQAPLRADRTRRPGRGQLRRPHRWCGRDHVRHFLGGAELHGGASVGLQHICGQQHHGHYY